jgi:hypothetical protein
VWDIVFYGNKLFQSTIISVTIGGKPNLYAIYEYTLINAAVALAGYYMCALTIDANWMGRTRMQAMGFAVTCILFLVCGFLYTTLITPEYIRLFQALYFLSSFWGQWGPNGTTFILPSELFPTDIRSQAHGISAAMGKFGALTSTLVFSYGAGGNKVAPETIFIVNGFASLLGFVLTVVFIPNTTKVTLEEIDMLWECRLHDKPYTGSALHADHLSTFERLVEVHSADADQIEREGLLDRHDGEQSTTNASIS